MTGRGNELYLGYQQTEISRLQREIPTWGTSRCIVRVLQKHVSNRIYTYKEIYCKELAPVLVEVKSQDLKAADRRLRSTKGIILVWKAAGSSPKKRHFFSLCLKAGKDLCPSPIVRQERFLLILRLLVLFRSSIDWMRPTYIRKIICFIQSTQSNINLI